MTEDVWATMAFEQAVAANPGYPRTSQLLQWFREPLLSQEGQAQGVPGGFQGDCCVKPSHTFATAAYLPVYRELRNNQIAQRNTGLPVPEHQGVQAEVDQFLQDNVGSATPGLVRSAGEHREMHSVTHSMLPPPYNAHDLRRRSM